MSARMKVRRRKYRTYLSRSPILWKPLEQMNGDSDENDVIEQVSLYVLAPCIDSFVLWVLQEAMKKGIQRLYFLARDGYFMYKSACQLCENLDLRIECRYLCCSRYSIRIPVFHLNQDEALEYICRGGIDVTMNKILNRSGIGKMEARKVLQELNLPFAEDEVIPYAKLTEVREKLKNSRYFLECLNQHSKEAMPGLQGYLQQEGLLEEGLYAIVDSGWVGSMQKTLNQVLRMFGRRCELEGYYWGLYELPEDVDETAYHCYYFNPKQNLREKVYFSNCLFEAVFSAPHGMTLEYQQTESGYQPRFSECGIERIEFMKRTENYLKWYTAELTKSFKYGVGQMTFEEIDCKRNKVIIRKLLKLFMGAPTKEEAEVYGALKFSDDVLDTETQQVAALLNGAELRANHVWNKALVMLGVRHGYIKESAWYEGSAARYGQYVMYHRLQYVMYKYLLYIRKRFKVKGEKNVK